LKQYGFISVFLFVTLVCSSQTQKDIELIRTLFQDIKTGDDAETIISFQIMETDEKEISILNAYKGAAQCMKANYVFSSLSKLKHFNEGKKILEESIAEYRNVESVYLRLLIQLNVPKILGYYKEIDGDILFLQENIASEPIDVTYKNLMIKNLIGVAKSEEQKNALLQIELIESS